MTVTLRIHFTGLFMFVRRRQTLHVLLPATTGAGSHRPTLSQIECSEGRPLRERGAITLDGIRACSLDDVQLPDWAFDTGIVTGTEFPLCQLGGSPTPSVHIRLDLPLPSQALEPGATANWEVAGKAGHFTLTNKLVYTLRGEALPTLAFVRKRFGSSTEEERIALQPMGRELKLYLHHLPPFEPACSDVQKGRPAAHVQSYYDLYCPSVKGTIPTLGRDPADCSRDASTYTCMIGKGTLPPS